MIELKTLGRTFHVGDQTVHALRDVDLTIETGEYVSIMGPSGSGKSTLLNILGLLDRPSTGSYLLNGTDVAHLGDDELALQRREHIGFVFQFFHLVPRLSAVENVELPLTLAGTARSARRQKAEQVLGAVGLEDRMDHRPDQLSGGQRQRVAIARAIVTEPDVLLADEPTGNLDSRSGAEIIEIIEGLNARGITLIVVTHDPEIGERSGRLLLLKDGRIDKDERRK